MQRILFDLLPLLVIAWTVLGAVEYKRLKRELKNGRREFLLREYRLTVAGELVFGVLSVLAVGIGIIHPSPAFRLVLPAGASEAVWGLLAGVLVSFAIWPLLARRGVRPPQVGDIEALLPRTQQEKMLYAAVAVSAGVCEELLFRGFGFRLFAQAGLTSMTLLLVTALAFGLAHIYQGVAGVVGTFLIGFILGITYITTGSLLVPIILHTIIDLRALTLPKIAQPP